MIFLPVFQYATPKKKSNSRILSQFPLPFRIVSFEAIGITVFLASDPVRRNEGHQIRGPFPSSGASYPESQEWVRQIFSCVFYIY